VSRPRAALLAFALAFAACGEPDQTPAGPTGPATRPGAAGAVGPMVFADVTAGSGLTLRNVNGNTDRKPTILESLGQGAAALDYDGDGDLDLFVGNGDTLNGEPKGAEPFTELYRHDTPFRFTPVGTSAGLKLRGWFQGAYAADWDADGRPDLFLTAHGGSRLFRNAGGGKFEDVTQSAGGGIPGWTSGAAFFDADQDGDLDLFVARYVQLDLARLPNEGKLCAYRSLQVACGPHGLVPETDLFLENVGGRFVDATAKFGFDVAPAAYGLGVVAFDFDQDGDVDVYVANDSMANDLWENRKGRFVNVAGLLGCDLGEGGRAQASMGIDAADVDRDGRSDLFMTNFEHDTNTLYLNLGSRGFFDATGSSGLGPPSFPSLGWGTRMLDFDRDGWVDVVVANGHIYPQVDGSGLETSYAQRNQMFRGTGKNAAGEVRFEEVLPKGGFFEPAAVNRGLVSADFDDDGDQDLFIVRVDALPAIGRNDTAGGGHWVGVALEGKPPNRDAIGAVLVVRDTAGVVRRAERAYGASFYSTCDPRLWMALGPASVSEARVVWPDGSTTPLSPTILDRYVRVGQESGAVTEWRR
jgi:enediyne biosynthesis protein E4